MYLCAKHYVPKYETKCFPVQNKVFLGKKQDVFHRETKCFLVRNRMFHCVKQNVPPCGTKILATAGVSFCTVSLPYGASKNSPSPFFLNLRIFLRFRRSGPKCAFRSSGGLRNSRDCFCDSRRQSRLPCLSKVRPKFRFDRSR